MLYTGTMKRSIFIIAVLLLALVGAAQAQNGATQLANQSRISVLSKAGAPVPRPAVPVRYVPMPAGAQRGTSYYYGYGYGGGYGYGLNYGSSSTTSTRTNSKESSIPGLVTRPRSSYSERFRR